MLNSQLLSGTIGSSLAPATLAPAPADGTIHFGDTVMLSASLGGVLAFDTANKSEVGIEAYTVTRTTESGAVACARTAWTICPPSAGMLPPEDGRLRIGQAFALSCQAADGTTLYLQSVRYTLHNQNYAGTGGLGQGVAVVPNLSTDCLWKVCSLLRRHCAEAEGPASAHSTYGGCCHCLHACCYALREPSTLCELSDRSRAECARRSVCWTLPIWHRWRRRDSLCQPTPS